MQKLVLAAIFTILLSGLAPQAALASNDIPRGILKLNGLDAPPLKLKNLNGDEWNIANARGKWVFVHFWASWCGPCRKEMPTIQAIIPEFKNTKLKIVLVNTAETYDTAFSFIGSIAPQLDTLLDSDGQATKRWQPRGLPSTYFVDPQGKLRYLALGGRAWSSKPYLNFLHRLIKQ